MLGNEGLGLRSGWLRAKVCGLEILNYWEGWTMNRIGA